MKGRTTIILSLSDVKQAVQQYIDSQFKESPGNISTIQEKKDGICNANFEVVIEPHAELKGDS